MADKNEVDVIDGKQLQDKYLREEMMPHIFCNGCGLGNVLDYVLWAVEKEGLDLDKTVFLSGIGCSSRIPGYINADALHTTHGRALAFATGVKMANPDLNVIVFTGDGDCFGIGGNHFIHALRRNLDITVIAVNNYIYGMTGGQVAPTTPEGHIGTTAPYGNIEPPFDMCEMAKAAGATYVARWPVFRPHQPINSIREGIRNKGLSFIEMMSPCTTAYGRRNRFRKIEDLWAFYEDKTILIEEYDKIDRFGTEEEKEELDDKIKIGVFKRSTRKPLEERYRDLLEEFK